LHWQLPCLGSSRRSTSLPGRVDMKQSPTTVALDSECDQSLASGTTSPGSAPSLASDSDSEAEVPVSRPQMPAIGSLSSTLSSVAALIERSTSDAPLNSVELLGQLSIELARLKGENSRLRKAAVGSSSPPRTQPGPLCHGESPDAPRTSFMLRNVPSCYTQHMLMALLDEEGFAGRYNFFYLVFDHKTRMNRGYAFVNLCDSVAASQFQRIFHGFSNWALPTRKVCTLAGCDRQGLQANIDHYRASQASLRELREFRPLVLIDGSFQTLERKP